MDSQTQLSLRKAELKAKLNQQRAAMNDTLLEVRNEIEPANLLKKAVSGVFGFSKSKGENPMAAGLGRLPGPVSFLVDVLVRDPKWKIGLKLIGPVVMKFLPRSNAMAANVLENGSDFLKAPQKFVRGKLLGSLRQGIGSLRKSLRKSKTNLPSKPY